MHGRQPSRVVVHLGDGTLIKGYLENSFSARDPSLLDGEIDELPPRISLLSASGENRNVELTSAKALFFVGSFEGTGTYSEVKFFEASPASEGLWVRVGFHDTEVTEGIVRNSLAFVRSSGFFLRPPDPQSNNKLIYVMKTFLTDFCVLGVRNRY